MALRPGGRDPSYAVNRCEDSYLAGDAAILQAPNSHRFSRDLDYFQDSTERVASAFEADLELLTNENYNVDTELSQLGYIRAIISRGSHSTKIEWARDSTWRFMPVMKSDNFGYQLHPVDLATNKVLALTGREESRDLIDTLYLHKEILSLGALVWAAVGKDPGVSPLSLLEMLQRRGRIHPEELDRLTWSKPWRRLRSRKTGLLLWNRPMNLSAVVLPKRLCWVTAVLNRTGFFS